MLLPMLLPTHCSLRLRTRAAFGCNTTRVSRFAVLGWFAALPHTPAAFLPLPVTATRFTRVTIPVFTVYLPLLRYYLHTRAGLHIAAVTHLPPIDSRLRFLPGSLTLPYPISPARLYWLLLPYAVPLHTHFTRFYIPGYPFTAAIATTTCAFTCTFCYRITVVAPRLLIYLFTCGSRGLPFWAYTSYQFTSRLWTPCRGSRTCPAYYIPHATGSYYATRLHTYVLPLLDYTFRFTISRTRTYSHVLPLFISPFIHCRLLLPFLLVLLRYSPFLGLFSCTLPVYIVLRYRILRIHLPFGCSVPTTLLHVVSFTYHICYHIVRLFVLGYFGLYSLYTWHSRTFSSPCHIYIYAYILPVRLRLLRVVPIVHRTFHPAAPHATVTLLTHLHALPTFTTRCRLTVLHVPDNRAVRVCVYVVVARLLRSWLLLFVVHLPHVDSRYPITFMPFVFTRIPLHTLLLYLPHTFTVTWLPYHVRYFPVLGCCYTFFIADSLLFLWLRYTLYLFCSCYYTCTCRLRGVVCYTCYGYVVHCRYGSPCPLLPLPLPRCHGVVSRYLHCLRTLVQLPSTFTPVQCPVLLIYLHSSTICYILDWILHTGSFLQSHTLYTHLPFGLPVVALQLDSDLRLFVVTTLYTLYTFGYILLLLHTFWWLLLPARYVLWIAVVILFTVTFGSPLLLLVGFDSVPHTLRLDSHWLTTFTFLHTHVVLHLRYCATAVCYTTFTLPRCYFTLILLRLYTFTFTHPVYRYLYLTLQLPLWLVTFVHTFCYVCLHTVLWYTHCTCPYLLVFTLVTLFPCGCWLHSVFTPLSLRYLCSNVVTTHILPICTHSTRILRWIGSGWFTHYYTLCPLLPFSSCYTPSYYSSPCSPLPSGSVHTHIPYIWLVTLVPAYCLQFWILLDLYVLFRFVSFYLRFLATPFIHTYIYIVPITYIAVIALTTRFTYIHLPGSSFHCLYTLLHSVTFYVLTHLVRHLHTHGCTPHLHHVPLVYRYAACYTRLLLPTVTTTTHHGSSHIQHLVWTHLLRFLDGYTFHIFTPHATIPRITSHTLHLPCCYTTRCQFPCAPWLLTFPPHTVIYSDLPRLPYMFYTHAYRYHFVTVIRFRYYTVYILRCSYDFLD